MWALCIGVLAFSSTSKSLRWLMKVGALPLEDGCVFPFVPLQREAPWS